MVGIIGLGPAAIGAGWNAKAEAARKGRKGPEKGRREESHSGLFCFFALFSFFAVSSLLGREGRQQVGARLLTAPAGIGADGTMLVHRRVLRALRAADLAGPLASLHLAAQQTPIGLGLARQEPAGRIADVGAVEIEADTAYQLLHHLLA